MKILATIATTALLFSFTGVASAHGGRHHDGGHFAHAPTPQFEIRQECRGFGRARRCREFRVQIVDNNCHEHHRGRFGTPDISFDRSFDAPTQNVHCHSASHAFRDHGRQFNLLVPLIRELRRNARDDRRFRGNQRQDQRRGQRRGQRRDQSLNREIRQAERDERVFQQNQRAEREAARRSGRSDRANRRARGDNGNRVVFIGRGVIPMDMESERDSQGPAD